jgi:hypothetical protein
MKHNQNYYRLFTSRPFLVRMHSESKQSTPKIYLGGICRTL